MNITPMDMQVVIPKATEVGKGQQQRDHQSVAQQQHGAVQFQQDANAKMRQVRNTEKSEGKKIRGDEEKKKGRHGEKQQGGGGFTEDETDDVKMAVDVMRGRNIDIKM